MPTLLRSFPGLFALAGGVLGLAFIGGALLFQSPWLLLALVAVKKSLTILAAAAILGLFRDRRKICAALSVPVLLLVYFAPKFLVFDDYHRINGDWSHVNFVNRTGKGVDHYVLGKNGVLMNLPVHRTGSDEPYLFAGPSFFDTADSDLRVGVAFADGSSIPETEVPRKKDGDLLRSVVVFVRDSGFDFSLKY